MNRTHWEHALFGILMQLPVGIFYSWVAGALVAIAFFTSREHAQREFQIAQARGCRIGQLKWWEGFCGWSRDAILDLAFPSVVTIGIAIGASL